MAVKRLVQLGGLSAGFAPWKFLATMVAADLECLRIGPESGHVESTL
jgi:hypothetical protein